MQAVRGMNELGPVPAGGTELAKYHARIMELDKTFEDSLESTLSTLGRHFLTKMNGCERLVKKRSTLADLKMRSLAPREAPDGAIVR